MVMLQEHCLVAELALENAVIPNLVDRRPVVEEQRGPLTCDHDCPGDRLGIRMLKARTVSGEKVPLAAEQVEQLAAGVALTSVVGKLQRPNSQPRRPALLRQPCHRSSHYTRESVSRQQAALVSVFGEHGN